MGSASSRMSASPLAGSFSSNGHTSGGPIDLANMPADQSLRTRPSIDMLDPSNRSSHAPTDGPSQERAQRISVSSTIGKPMANVTSEEKEEGEISDGEEEIPARFDASAANAGPSDHRRSYGYGERYPSERSFTKDRYVRTISPRKTAAPSIAGPSNYAPQQSYRPAPVPRPASLSSGPGRVVHPPSTSSTILDDASSLAVPADISPEHAKKYMDIIRKLLQSGCSPEMLVKKGATAKYVTAVCEEIVQDTKRRKQLWMGTSSSTPPGPRDIPDSRSSEALRLSGSPSSEVEELVSTERRGSLSMEVEADSESTENLSSSQRRRLVPSSHWEPSVDSTRSSTPSLPPAHAVRIDTYKPPQPVTSSTSTTTAVHPAAPYASFSSSIQAQRPQSSDALGITEHPIAPSPPQPRQGTPPVDRKKKTKKSKKSKKSKDKADSSGPATSNYEDEESSPVYPPSSAASSSTPLPISPLRSAKSPPRPIVAPLHSRASDTASWSASAPPSVSSAPLTHPPVQPSSVGRSPIPAGTTLPAAPPSLPLKPSQARLEAQAQIDKKNAIIEARRKVSESMQTRRQGQPIVKNSIEQEMSDLEQEVRESQTVAEQHVPMDICEPEEGEITPSSLPAPLPVPVMPIPIASSSSPNSTRGVKRPRAEDSDSRPTSTMARPRRRAFGGPPLKPSRLVINLDDHSDTDSEDESGSPALVAGIDMVMRQKESQIQLLKEKIAKRMKEKAAMKFSEASASPPPRGSETAVDTAARTASGEASGAGSRASEHSKSEDAVADEAVEAISVIRGDPPNTGASDHVVEPVSASQNATTDPPGGVPSTARAPDQVSISAGGASSEAAPAAQPHFREYKSVMRRYPQSSAETLSSQSFPQFSLKPPTSKPLASVFTSLDRQLLSSIISTNRLAVNPHAIICPAEAGGGVCADSGCDASHLCKGDPEDWTEYVFQAITTSIGTAEVDKGAIARSVHQVMRKEAKGKGKATGPSHGQVNANMLASDSASSGFLAKLGQAYMAEKGSDAT